MGWNGCFKVFSAHMEVKPELMREWEVNFSRFFEQQDSVIQNCKSFRIPTLTGFCTRNPGKDGRSLPWHGGDIHIATGCLGARLHVCQSMADAKIHVFHVEATSIVMDLH